MGSCCILRFNKLKIWRTSEMIMRASLLSWMPSEQSLKDSRASLPADLKSKVKLVSLFPLHMQRLRGGMLVGTSHEPTTMHELEVSRKEIIIQEETLGRRVWVERGGKRGSEDLLSP